MDLYQHYDNIDANGFVIGIFSAFSDYIPTKNDICVAKNQKKIYTLEFKKNGYPVYRYVNNVRNLCTQEDINFFSLNEYKEIKIAYLNSLCEHSIEDGFTSSATGVSHFYRFNKAEDQLNFNQQISLILLQPNIITNIYWKTEDAGIVLHTKDQFLTVVNDAATHKQNNINKYWTLKAQVQAATSKAAIDNINW